MDNNICNNCKKEIKEIYYFGIKRIKLCKDCYEKEMKKENMEEKMMRIFKSSGFSQLFKYANKVIEYNKDKDDDKTI